MTNDEFVAYLMSLPPVERRQVWANCLRAIGLEQCAQAWERGERPPIALLESELAEVNRQAHADEVAAELLADIEL